MRQPNNQTMERDSSNKQSPKEDGKIRETIATLAYRFSEERGDERGSPLDDWLRAERVVLEQHAH